MTARPPRDAWIRARGEHVLHRDTDAHARLVARTLGVDVETWARVLDRYAERWQPERDDTQGRLATLAEAFADVVPGAPPDALSEPAACPVCGASTRVAVTRRNEDAPLLSTWARCDGCGHGSLVAGAAEASVYEDAAYYRARDRGGAGYDDYAAERVYRESKGAALLERIARLSGRSAKRLLEVGSGFGFTRKAALDWGMTTVGVDVSPHAAAGAERLYGLSTFQGTLGDALGSPGSGVARGGFDLVLYQFVLEHLADPARELRDAVATLAQGGVLAILVPSMDAAELDVFRGAYRSLRRDHLHLFSRRSLEHALAASGARPLAFVTQCNLHLFGGVVRTDELALLYSALRGPDLLGLAVREDP